MKTTILFLTSLFCLSLSAQQFAFEKVITVDSADASALFDRAISWVSVQYNSPEKVIQVNDRQSGTLSLRPVFFYEHEKTMYKCYAGTVTYSLAMQFRDGRAKVTVSNFTHRQCVECSPLCGLGLITTEPTKAQSLCKKCDQVIWDDLKVKCEAYAVKLFDKIEAALKASDEW